MAQFPITGVGGIADSKVATPTIQNTAQAIGAVGILAPALRGAVVYSDGNRIDFNFIEPISEYVNRFAFGEGLVQTKITLGDSLNVGEPSVKNLAFGVMPVGIGNSAIVIGSRIASPLVGQYISLNFNFTTVNTPQNPYFHFGTAIITKAGGISSLNLGKIEKIEQPFAIKPTGIASPVTPISWVSHAETHPLNFNFKLPLVATAPHFVFDGATLVTKAGVGNQQRVASPSIWNMAQAIGALGFDGSNIGNVVGFKKTTDSRGTVDFDFAQGIVGSNARNVAFYFYEDGVLNPTGIAGNSFGLADVKNSLDRLYSLGVDGSQFGIAKIVELAQIPPADEVENNRQIATGNIDSIAFGEPTIWLSKQWGNPPGLASQVVGVPMVSHFLRYLLVQGKDSISLGTPWLSHYTRTIEPLGIFDNFSHNHRIGGTQTISPNGFEATAWGTRIIPESQTLYPKAFIGQIGEPTIMLALQYITPKGFASYHDTGIVSNDGGGIATVFNSRQYITQLFDNQSGLLPPPFGQWVAIENRNKTVGTIGWQSQKFGYQQVDNNARVVEPVSIIPPELDKQRISHWRQRIMPEAIEPVYFSGWINIRNDARVVAPPSADYQAVGKPSVVNTRRYFTVGNFETASYGKPMVDYAVRTLTLWDSMIPPFIPVPTIDNLKKYVEPTGFDSNGRWQSQVSNPDLAIHFNSIAPKWIDRQYLWFGEASINNLTPELKQQGRNSEAFGEANIRTQWREIQAWGERTEIFGSAEIGYRIKRIDLSTGGIASLIFGKAKVTKSQDDILTGSQAIFPESIDIPKNQIPSPSFNQSVIYPLGMSGLKMGEPRVVVGSIRIMVGIYETLFGRPAIGLKIRTLAPQGIDEWVNENRMGKPQFSPHTIYAVMEVPTQARRNHPAVELRYIDSQTVFGYPTVKNKIQDTQQTIYTYGLDNVKFGDLNLNLSKQYIKPTGFRGGYFGWHSIPYVPQTIEVFNDSPAPQTVLGVPSVNRPSYLGVQAINTYGFTSQSIGSLEVQNQNRPIYPVGTDMLRVGQSEWWDTPYAWQHLHIGEPVKIKPQGFDNLMVSENTFISLRIRDIRVQGVEVLRMSNEAFDFKYRMKVTRTPRPVLKTYINPQGFHTEQIGILNTKHGQYFIHPDGNSDTYRQGIPL